VNRFEKSTTARQIRIERAAILWRLRSIIRRLNISTRNDPAVNEIIVALETDEHVEGRVSIASRRILLTHYNFLDANRDSDTPASGPQVAGPS